jgi:hypothetical protein
MLLPLPLIWRVRLPLVESFSVLSNLVHQTFSHRPLQSWLRCHRSKHSLLVDRISKGLHRWRQLYNMVQHLTDGSSSSSLCASNPDPLPQTLQAIKSTTT